MSTFKPKRVTGADLASQLSGATASLPPVVVQQRPIVAPPTNSRERPPPVVQVNFKATEEFADLIAQAAQKAGSTRRFIARLMRDAG